MMLDKGPGWSDSYSGAARGRVSPVWMGHALDTLNHKLGLLMHTDVSFMLLLLLLSHFSHVRLCATP